MLVLAGMTLTASLNCRGLAKGYVEALEHRLAATEQILLNLMAVVGDDAVESAFRGGSMLRDGASGATSAGHTGIASRAEVQKSDLLATWQQFPLETAEHVRKWAEHARRPAGGPSAEGFCGTSAHPTLPATFDNMDEFGDSAVNNDLSGAEEETLYSTPSPGRQLQLDQSRGLHQSATELSDQQSAEDDSQHFALPLDFRNQYLW